ncbi:hypothetical protein [Aurantibacter sp.]|uniref:hypothetical protein n=1 Tax=Aurantibacter sp. TaxID=2807103 RepID=UPI0032657153
MRFIKLVFLVFVFTTMLSTNFLQANLKMKSLEILREVKDVVLGSWDYYVPGVEPAYANGVMHVTNLKGDYNVNLELPGGTIPTNNVEVNGNEITFDLYVEGMLVDVKIVIDGDALTGSGNTDQGPFTMTGTRKK